MARVQHRHLGSDKRDTGARLLLPAGFFLDRYHDWARRCAIERGLCLTAGAGPRQARGHMSQSALVELWRPQLHRLTSTVRATFLLPDRPVTATMVSPAHPQAGTTAEPILSA